MRTRSWPIFGGLGLVFIAVLGLLALRSAGRKPIAETKATKEKTTSLDTSNVLPVAPKSPTSSAHASGQTIDWPVFRGNGLQTGLAGSSLPEPIVVRWVFTPNKYLLATRVGSLFASSTCSPVPVLPLVAARMEVPADGIESTVAIFGGTAYVGSLDEHLFALDLSTGRVNWVYKAGPIRSPVGFSDQYVYVGDTDGLLHCLSATTGRRRWVFNAEAEITSGLDFTADAVLFGTNDESLCCLSKQGEQRWRFRVPGGPVMGTPAVVGNRTFAAGCDSTLHVIDLGSGRETGNTIDLGGQVGASVAVLSDRLYVGTMSSQVLGIDWMKGEILWSFEAASRRQPFFSSPAVTDQLVIVGSRDHRVYALDRQTGQPVWSFPTRKKVDSSPVVVGQRVFVGSSDGNLYVLDLDNGTELQKFALGSAITASPAVGGNCLVIGTTDGTVYCLGAKRSAGK